MRSGATAVIAVFLALDACGGSRASGPDWPESAGTSIDLDDDATAGDDADEDGGESLEPRQRAEVASIESSETKISAGPDAAPSADAAPGTPDAAPGPDAAPTAGTEPPVVEEITIEVKGN